MKTILEINSTNYSSTGNIMLNIAKEARKQGYKVYTCCKISKESKKHIYEDQIYIGFQLERILSSFVNSLTGLRDYGNIFGTLLFIKKLKKIKPDLIHLHTLHDDYINVRILFNYLRKTNVPVIWTFHDCVSFTGKCPYFDMVNCDKWVSGCCNCPQQHIRPNNLFFDTSYIIWNNRKKWFTSINQMHIITPSTWLEENVKKSFFSKYEISTINNGIDLEAFKNIDNNILDKYNVDNKYIILGVANSWGKRKGMDIFIDLANVLPKEFQIILVGTNDKVDRLLPDNIISIHRTYNQKELAKLYSSADLFVNPTREENFPTVNIESLACGTPVLTFNTGGSPEIVNNKCGKVVEKNDIDDLVNEIKRICIEKPYSKEDCITQSKQFDMNLTFKKYISLYSDMIN